VEWLLRQKAKNKGKLYAPLEPEADCISKGEARVCYEFGTKVSVATTHKEGFVVGAVDRGEPLRRTHAARGVGAGGNPDRDPPEEGVRGSRLLSPA
jgi:hypothetical protein